MKLFDADWAPSPRRVRIFLAEKGLSVPVERLDIKTGEHLEPGYRAINPQGQLPALLLDDGRMIDDSLGICRYFEALHPEPALFGRDAVEIGMIESWIRRIEHDCYGAAAMSFRNSVHVFADRAISGQWPAIAQIPELAKRGRLMWDAFADIFDKHLEGRDFIVGDNCSMADIVALVAIDFGRSVRMADPLDRPALARWHAAMSARPSAAA